MPRPALQGIQELAVSLTEQMSLAFANLMSRETLNISRYAFR